MKLLSALSEDNLFPFSKASDYIGHANYANDSDMFILWAQEQ